MIPSAERRPAFTLIEVIVTLAVIGIALAVVGPALIVHRPAPGISEVLTQSRRAALRRGESVVVRVTADGVWQGRPAQASDQALISGEIAPLPSGPVEILISPLGVCTVRRGRLGADRAFNPLTCSVSGRDKSQ